MLGGLKYLWLWGSLVILLWLTAIISNLGEVLNPEIYIYYPMRLSCSIILYWIGYQGFFNYKILTQRIQIREDIALETDAKIDVPNIEVENNDNQFTVIKNHIENNNRYLDPNFSLEILASETKINASKVSSIINNYSEYNFSEYINILRVEKAKTLFLESKYKLYNNEAIGYECGFNSKSTFYSAFKKFTNQTPSEFKKQNC